MERLTNLTIDKAFLVTEKEYLDIAKPHIEKDTLVTEKDAKKKENILNSHSYQLCRTFGLCDAQDCD